MVKQKRLKCKPKGSRRGRNRWDPRLEQYTGFTHSLSDRTVQALENKMLENIQGRIDERAVFSTNGERRWAVFAFPARAIIAASVLFFVALGVYFFYQNRTLASERTTYGETRAVKLPDGSEVVLNGNSEIRYSSDWSEAEVREVYLKGEAYFNVTRISGDLKFRVYTDADFSLDVLGTQFTVSSRKLRTRVVLNEGKIQCYMGKAARDTIMMKPGEMVQFGQTTSDYIRKEVESSIYSAWKDQKLVFDNTPLEEILSILEETYGLKASVKDQTLLSRQISGSVPTDDIGYLLEGIGEASGVSIERKGNDLTISARERPAMN